MTDDPNTTPPAPSKPRGFAGLPPEEQRRIASLGGRAVRDSGRAHKFTPAEAKEAGAKGGSKVSRDREHMRAIAKKGAAVRRAKREAARGGKGSAS